MDQADKPQEVEKPEPVITLVAYSATATDGRVVIEIPDMQKRMMRWLHG